MRETQNDRKERILDDMARLAGGAVSLIGGVGQQAASEMRSRVDDLASDMDLVPREDFKRVEHLLSQSLLRIEALEKRIEKLEKKKA